MKGFGFCAVLVVCFVASQFGLAQAVRGGGDQVEAGAFVDYFHIGQSHPSINYAGLGGRLALNLSRNAQIEGEMAYDFDRSYTNTFTNGVSTALLRSQTHVLHGYFGPKLQSGSGSTRFFVTGKAGLISFTTSTQSVPAGFKSALGAIGNGNAKFAVYPGGGVEGFLGPLGLRLEVGDDIYFDHGTRNNLRVTFGPSIRF